MKHSDNLDDVVIDTMNDNVRQVWHGQETRLTGARTAGMRKTCKSINGHPDTVHSLVGGFRIISCDVVANGLEMSKRTAGIGQLIELAKNASTSASVA